MEPKKSVQRFYSVDPLAEKKHWLSPYHFCSNNPLNRIDPDGLTDYTIDSQGYISPVEGTENKHEGFDMLYIKEQYDKGITTGGLKVNDKALLYQLSKETGFKNAYNNDINYGITESIEDAFGVFFFSVDNHNTKVEWQLDVYKVNGKNKYIIGTAHSCGDAISTDGGRRGISRFGFRLKDQIYSLHSHPNTSEAASNGDQQVYARKYWDLNNGNKGSIYPANHFVYNVNQKVLYRFDYWIKDDLKRPISKTSDLYRGLVK